ncbi:MAG: ABC transporter permease [Planctomycetes bacterium]|nr:ABC transporter permease [Planctomycetota bacterium]MCB9904260.1 ABC transporter permease [Planctomycetota bacterium]
MLAITKSLFAQKRLLKDLVVRDLKARYVGSSMGFFWSVVFPILNLFVYMFVFNLVLNMRWSDHSSNGEVPLIMLIGILIWVAFSETVSRTTNCLVENANLIQKVVFPSEVLPIYLTGSSLVNMTLGIVVAMFGIAWFAYVDPTTFDWDVVRQNLEPGEPMPRVMRLGMPLVTLPILYVLQAVFTIGLGYMLATLNLILRDTYHLVGVFLTVWMFGTPIFYPAALVEKAGYGWLLNLNPMYWLIDSYRDVLIYGDWPRLGFVVQFGVVAVVTFALGAAFFRSQKDRFPDLL